VWKRISPSPALPLTVPRTQQLAAALVHLLLILMMLLLPVTGYLISTSAGQGIPVYGWFEVPALWKVGETTLDLVIAIHTIAPTEPACWPRCMPPPRSSINS
jgi:cytochrome b561